LEESNFWLIVKELYPLFLEIILFYGAIVLGKGIIKKLGGDKEGISNAITKILIAFFWAHISIPLVLGIYSFMERLSDTIEPVIRTFGR